MQVHARRIDWSRIDTVLLDMDGTLLDLRFDNWFWQELVPRRWAAAQGLHGLEAAARLTAKFAASRGTLQWYCIDHWSRELGLDLARIKAAAETRARVAYLPGALDFLAQLKATGKRRVLVTNAHPTTLAIKDEQVGVARHFDACYSTHAFRAPKEHDDFWPRLQRMEPFEQGRTLLVDDSLAVLQAADRHGIAWLRAVRRPDSGRPAQNTGEFMAVDRVADLFEQEVR